MEYFRLEQDKRIPFNIWIRKLSMLTGYFEANRGNVGALKMMNPVEIAGDSCGNYPEVFDKQLFMVKEEIKKVLDLYNPIITYREFVLIDKVQKSYERYYAPVLPFVDCLSEKSVCNPDKSVIHKAVIKKSRLTEDCIFRIDSVADKVIVIRLDVAESILRRKVAGIQLHHVEFEND